ncbi:MAG: hypothetical protein V4507_17335, partial [Verrucomicrobiota bacterium]
SQALLEAMILGLPCFYTEECYFEEAIQTGGAWKIERDPSQITEKLISLFHDLEGYKTKALAAQKLVEDRYLWSSIGANLRGKYRKEFL